MARRAWRVVQGLLGLVIVGLAVRQVLRGWHDVQATPFAWQLRPHLVLASLLLVWGMYAVLIGTWRFLVRRWGAELGARDAAAIWIVSSLGKYLPGKLWSIAGMAVMARRAGVAPWIATGAAVINQVLALATGVVVVAFTGTAGLEVRYPWLRTGMAVLLGLSLAGTALLSSGPLLRRLMSMAGGDPEAAPPPPPPAALLLAAAANVAAWVGYGGALWLLARGLTNAPLDLGLATGSFAGSYVVGFLALVAPAGLGVRESVFILMLDPTVGTPAAVALAVASRLLLTVAELGAAVPFLLTARERARVAP